MFVGDARTDTRHFVRSVIGAVGAGVVARRAESASGRFLEHIFVAIVFAVRDAVAAGECRRRNQACRG